MKTKLPRNSSSLEKLLGKMESYCAYQERSVAETRKKLLSHDISPAGADKLIENLSKRGFLNEQRFANAFAHGKFRLMNWGKIKIELALKKHNLTSMHIQKALREINEEDYRHKLQQLLEKKARQYRDDPLQKQKLFRYALQKGYAPEDFRRVFEDVDF